MALNWFTYELPCLQLFLIRHIQRDLKNKEIMFHKEEEQVNQNVNFRTCFLLDMVD